MVMKLDLDISPIYQKGRNADSQFFLIFKEFKKQITNLHSCGHDNISSSTLKCIAHEICECLTLIINQSITTGIFPENVKIAKVVPIYKKDDQSQIKNYRPISVLPVIS